MRGLFSIGGVEVGWSDWFHSYLFFKRLLTISRTLSTELFNGGGVK